MEIRHILCIFLVFSMGCKRPQSISASEDSNFLSVQIGKEIDLSKSGETLMIRTEAAKKLCVSTSGIRSEMYSENTIFKIATLLDTTEDSVRYWVARALGNFGKRASFAVPKLLDLLKEVDPLRGSLTSASAIRFALSQMGEVVPPKGFESMKKD
jgi:HEAT repeat protein